MVSPDGTLISASAAPHCGPVIGETVFFPKEFTAAIAVMLAKPSAAFSVQTVTDASITKKERERGNQENSVLPIIRPVIGYTPHHDPPVMFLSEFIDLTRMQLTV